MQDRYMIVWAEGIGELMTNVNQVLNSADERWKCAGGIESEVYPNHPPRYYQAIERVD
tara:strand:+ start:4063 stop:4236 length:174 start_codon:yes stop_codon:yes gene_type:complete